MARYRCSLSDFHFSALPESQAELLRRRNGPQARAGGGTVQSQDPMSRSSSAIECKDRLSSGAKRRTRQFAGDSRVDKFFASPRMRRVEERQRAVCESAKG